VGDTGVGKSCLLLRFSEGSFKEQHNVTIGVEFGTKSVNINSQPVKLQIWDTAGQESFRSITRSFYRRADAVLLVYDATARHTFENCEYWIEEIRQNASMDVVVYLVGNQTDLIESGEEQREVNSDEAETFAKKHNLNGFCETSAKNGKNVEEAFMNFCKVLYDKWKQKRDSEPSFQPQGLSLVNVPKKKKKCC